jgi:hypothetical protein
MSLLPRFTAARGAFAVMALVAIAGTVTGVAMAAAPSAPSARSALRSQVTTPIDHQLCYAATGSGFQIPTVELENQFSTTPFTPTIGSVAYHCNPVAKTLPNGTVYTISNPSAHLLCWNITESTQPTPEVQVTNQFGTAVLQPSQPNLLCLPTWKSLTAPPNETPNQPPGLSHFTCYPVQEVSGGYNPPAVKLQDEFASAPVAATVNPVPVELCLPTEKIVGSTTYPILNSTYHLLCFPVSQTPIISPVFDQNQFVPQPPGGVKITITHTTWLCVPSTKQIV